jgi:hypothetical protein
MHCISCRFSMSSIKCLTWSNIIGQMIFKYLTILLHLVERKWIDWILYVRSNKLLTMLLILLKDSSDKSKVNESVSIRENSTRFDR